MVKRQSIPRYDNTALPVRGYKIGITDNNEISRWEGTLAILPGLNADVSRIPAGVVSGIGFLGAGTILVTGVSRSRDCPQRLHYG